MRINVLDQVGTREETYTVDVPATYDDDGRELTPARTETRTLIIPVMASVTRDMTPDEEAAFAADAPPEAPTELGIEGRLAGAEAAIATHDQEIDEIVTGLEALANG